MHYLSASYVIFTNGKDLKNFSDAGSVEKLNINFCGASIDIGIVDDTGDGMPSVNLLFDVIFPHQKTDLF